MQGRGLVGLTEIEAASRRLAGIIVPTPLIPADAISEAIDARVRLKCENLQVTGSFKARGACNAILSLPDEILSPGALRAFSAAELALQPADEMPVFLQRPDGSVADGSVR